MKLRVPTKHGFSMVVNAESFFGRSLMAHREYEHNETELIKSLIRKGDFAIDAGCNAGYFSCLMAKLGAKVLAIDANPTMADLTRENTEDLDDVEVICVALSDTNGKADFYLPSAFDDGWGSLVAADSDNGSIQVATARLDALMGPESVRLLKLDVEGWETQALRGAPLARIEHILVECVDIPKRANSGSCVQSINEVLAGRTVRECKDGKWEQIPAAYSTTKGSFLFSLDTMAQGR